jgi:hypothetical protein
VNFLAPIWLGLIAAVAVPLFLHLLRRRIDIRREFPAARYLLRAEKENVRRLKLRNMLLMLLRTLALLFLALAAARPIAALLGSGHVPTALVVVVDNTMSTGAIVDGSPLLSRLKAVARSVVGGAESNDQTWLVTADRAVTGGARNVVIDAIDRIEPLGGRGDLTGAITHAAGIALAAGLRRAPWLCSPMARPRSGRAISRSVRCGCWPTRQPERRPTIARSPWLSPARPAGVPGARCSSARRAPIP